MYYSFFYGDVMNIGVISSYVALVCLLTFLAMTGGLHAQTTAQSTVKVKKAKVAVAAPVVVDVNAVTNDGDEEGESVVTISRDGKDGQPRKLIIQRTVKNGKESILLNGKEVNENDKSLPEDVQQLLEDIGNDDGNMVIKLNSSTMSVGAEGGKSNVMVFNSSGGSKCDKIHIKINGLDSLNAIMDMEGMKKQCEEMKKQCQEMKQQFGEMGKTMHLGKTMHFNLDSLHTSCAWVLKDGAVPMQFRVMDIDSTISNRVFIYKNGDSISTQSFNFNFNIPDIDMDIDIPDMPDMPMVREFDTDNLGDIEALVNIPEAPDAPSASNSTIQKRYKVIIIEHPAGHDGVELNDDEASEGESDEPPVVQPSLPSAVVEPTSLRAEYFNVFPNPTPGALNISFALEQSSGDPVTVTVTDLLGNKVFDETLQNYSGQYHRQIDLTEKARGTYIVSVGRDGQTLTRQVAVR